MAKPGTTPLIYQIYVDAFARGSSGRAEGRAHGGDLEGVVERLDYVAGLGADAIWLTPIFPTPSDHGYNATDFFRVDPKLVPDPARADRLFEELVREAHARGVGVLLDLTLNHASHDYDLASVAGDARPLVREARTRQERSWTRDLKYFDHGDAKTRRFLFDVARYWVERFGVDGYRYDYVHGISVEFWEQLHAELAAIRPGLFFVGEYWEDVGSAEQNAREIAERFDAPNGPCFTTLFDFPFQDAATRAIGSGSAARLVEVLDLCDAVYPRHACAMLDNHDVARVADWAEGDPRRILNALRLLVSRAGPISVLYGTEVGLQAGVSARPGVDTSGRVVMDWKLVESDLYARSRALLRARRGVTALASGSATARTAVGPLFAEVRSGPDGSFALVVLNFGGDELRDADVTALGVANWSGVEIVDGTRLEVVAGRLATPMPPFGGGIYVDAP